MFTFSIPRVSSGVTSCNNVRIPIREWYIENKENIMECVDNICAQLDSIVQENKNKNNECDVMVMYDRLRVSLVRYLYEHSYSSTRSWE
jgi:hypothetical protein